VRRLGEAVQQQHEPAVDRSGGHTVEDEAAGVDRKRLEA
jgi:hypothetical protein